MAFVIAGAVCGGFVNGLAGFGTSLFALGWWLQVMPPLQAVALSLVLSVASGVQGVWLVHRAIDRRRLLRFLLPALLGMPIGLGLLGWIEAGPLRLILAAFLLAYGGFFAFRRNLPSLGRTPPLIDGLIGFLGGGLGALAGLSGALPTMWAALKPWTKAECRALLQPYNVTVLGLSAVLLAMDGVYDRDVLITIAIALPAALLAAQFGIRLFRRMNDADFRRLLIVLMLASGSILLFRTLF